MSLPSQSESTTWDPEDPGSGTVVLEKWRELLRAKGLEEKNPAWTAGLRDRILPAIGYFLTLTDVPGFHEKLDDFVNRCNKPTTSNQPDIQWASFCAELGAIRLLGCELGLEIVGFEEKSPHFSCGSRTCDVVALWKNHRVFCEVKRNSKEDSQTVPRSVWEAVEAEAEPYSVVMELGRDGRFSEFDTNSLRAEVRRHLEKWQRLKDEGYSQEEHPDPLCTQSITIHFNTYGGHGEYFDPASTRDLCTFLFGPARVGRDGSPMEPMVEQAASKGADYLLCRVADWEPLPKLLERCFEELNQQSTRTYTTRDERLKNLTGVILFSRFDSFVIVNRESAAQSLHIEA